jgi:hypothetical protein
LRRSLDFLRVIHADGYHESFPAARACLHLARLLFRLPWYHPCHLPPPPSEIMAYPHRQYFQTHHTALLAEREISLWRWRDTAARSFFRIYEGFCADHHENVGYETEYFWYRNDPAWSPEMLPDPREFGHLAAGEEGERQLAVLASAAEALADAFNWRYMHGFRRDRNHVEPSQARPPVYKAVFKGPPGLRRYRDCLRFSSSTRSTRSGRLAVKTTWSIIPATCAPSGSATSLPTPGR